jgi:hypothetical protein
MHMCEFHNIYSVTLDNCGMLLRQGRPGTSIAHVKSQIPLEGSKTELCGGGVRFHVWAKAVSLSTIRWGESYDHWPPDTLCRSFG